MDFIWSLIGFLLVIGILVTIHEWGHYQVARLFDIKVLEFSIGFGKAIYQKQCGETLYKVSILPLGGFVRFVDEREGEVDPKDLPRAFNRQSVYKRFAVVAAGPLINLFFAWLVFVAINLIGISALKPIITEVPVKTPLSQLISTEQLQGQTGQTQLWELVEFSGVQVQSWNQVTQIVMQDLLDHKTVVDLRLRNLDTQSTIHLPGLSLAALDLNHANQNWLSMLGFDMSPLPIAAKIGTILKEGPASKTNLQPGDVVTALNGISVTNWPDFVAKVQSLPNQDVVISYQRNGVEFTDKVQIASIQKGDQEIGRVGLGVFIDESTMAPFSNQLQYGFVESLQRGWQRLSELTVMSFEMIQRMLTGEVGLQNLSGPIGIAQMSGQAVQSGLISFLSLLGLLSLSIGILNLLPIPVLDGGHLLYYLVEMIKGSPVSDKIMLYGQSIGLFLIISLTLFAVFNDILRISNG